MISGTYSFCLAGLSSVQSYSADTSLKSAVGPIIWSSTRSRKEITLLFSFLRVIWTLASI